MLSSRCFRSGVTIFVIAQLVLSLLVPGGTAFARPDLVRSPAAVSETPGAMLATTLSVEIRSTPWVTLDSNNPLDLNTPHVYVVQARVTNTGAEAAADVAVLLDYNPDVANNWILLPGEVPQRSFDSLAPGASHDFYWFARYASSTTGPTAAHQYTVSASADNAPLVSTSDNVFGNPAPGATVMTRSTLSTGNSGLTQVSANIVVGVAFTVTVGYDLGTNPANISFSPVGNTDFNPGAYRLLSTSVRFYNDAGTWENIVPNQLYYPTLDGRADNAQARFVFIAQKAANTRLCTYADVGYSSNNKYDQFYCDQKTNTTIPIEGDLLLTMSKQAGSGTILQGQSLGYTIQYANTSLQPLIYTWVWDDVDTSIASIEAASVNPAPDLDETTASRVAWNIGEIPAAGQPGATGTHTFSVLVDGNGQDLPDGTSLVNRAYFGINPGSLPATAALTSTVITTVQAPVISIQKTDGQATAQQGQALNYTITVNNSGSALATGLVITDQLPASLTPGTITAPSGWTCGVNGQLVTCSSNTGTVLNGGGSAQVVIPVTVKMKVLNGTVINNTATVQYQNAAGHVYATKSASDQTTVAAPVLTISKSGLPTTVLTGKVIVYTLAYTNTGPAPASQVVITDQVPANTTYQSCSGGDSCSHTGGVVTWNLSTIPAGGSGSVSFSVVVAESLNTGDVITNNTYAIISDQTAAATGPAVNTTVNRNAGVIEGVAYTDADGDGVYDPGETLLSGVEVSLPGAVIPVVTTGADGKFSFRVETEGPVIISAGDLAGYFHTTPPSVQLAVVLDTTKTINFGYAPNASPFGIIYGTVYNDGNASGTQQLGELGLAGVSVASSSAAASPVTTDAYGLYTLRFNSSGSVTIQETNLAGYISTTPDTVNTTATTGLSGASAVNFGDFFGIKITGLVFNDQNVNGAKDVSEPGLAGAIVSAGGKTFTTGSDGLYTLYVTLSGSGPLQISETDPASYVSTNAIPSTGMTRIDASTLQIAAPVSGTSYTDGNFADAQESGVVTVQGQVWNDNGAGGGLANGVKDGGEAGLAGAIVGLSSGLSATTDASGIFNLYAPANQVVTLSEQNPAGYASTNAIAGTNASKLNNDQIQINALAGGSSVSGNLFGDVLASDVAVVSGFVFDDPNENGVRDAGEPGLSQVKVTLETPGGTNEVITGASGAYEFTIPTGTNLMLSTTVPAGGYYPTTPQKIGAHIASAGSYPDNNFGYSNDTDSAVITGWVFDDSNSNGEPDFGEVGLVGAQVWLDDTSSVTTSSNGLFGGTFTFQVPAATTTPVVHNIKEINPPGYHSTTPDQINVSVNPGSNSYYVEFGDTTAMVASLYGTVFDDLNSNGVQDANELGMAGVTVDVALDGGATVISIVTKSYGQFNYGLVLNESGFYTVSSEDPALPGYHSTTPDTVNIFVELGKSYMVNFGDSNTGYVAMGTLYDDQNDDGTQDPAEVGLPNVTIALSSGATTTTNENGGYTISLADPASTPYIVRIIETDPAGYHSTTPNNVPVQVSAAQRVYQVNFGDSSNPFVTSIFGTVFHDANTNAAYDNELGLPGVTVKLQNGQAYDYVTNEWGQYTFRVEATGPYTLTETDLPGWVSTTALPGSAAAWVDNNTLRIQVDSLGTGLGGNLFGDTQPNAVATISGFVWNDNGSGGGVAGDGVRNGSEPGLAGALLTLSSGMKQTSAANGAFVLYGPPNQGLTVVETNPTGYISTGAVAGNKASVVNRDTLAVSALTAASSSTGNLFGDVQQSSVTIITGKVFNDQNGNGQQDSGEASIPGVQVKLDETTTRTTDATGSYEFITAVAGSHIVTETDPPGYFSTMPNTVYVDTVLDKTYTVDFGDTNLTNRASIFGTVYDDANNNSKRDNGELGVPGVSVKVDSGPTVLTDQYGRYTFAIQNAGIHQVLETDLIDYVSTTPNLQQVTVSLGNGYQVDFGDRLICNCTADGFEADNTPAQAKPILFGTVNLHSCNFCSDTTDWASFTAQAGGVYTITTSAKGVRADTYLELYASDGVTLLAANDDYAGATDYSSRIVFTAEQSGKYYIKVSNRAMLTHCSTEYEVKVDEYYLAIKHIYLPVITKVAAARQSTKAEMLLAPEGVINHSCPDAYEVDDTWQQAKSIVSGVPQVHSFDSNPAQFAADKDLVSFQVAAGDVISFTTQLTNTLVRLELFDQNGVALNVTGTNQLKWKAAEAGTYYLDASPLNYTFGCSDTAGYTLFYNVVETLKLIYLPMVIK